jgi:hypothetical protein
MQTLSLKGLIVSQYSLPNILAGVHDEIQLKLQTARKVLAHPGEKGDASGDVWIELFNKYLPARYRAEKAHVVDSKGGISDQIDVVIFDRQYSPFVFNFQNALYVPAESVYAVLESKQIVDASNIEYAQKKAASVRKLHQTSLSIPHAGGVYPPKPPLYIYGGVLSLESDWSPKLGATLLSALIKGVDQERLDIGCVAAYGHFYFDKDSKQYHIDEGAKSATAFLFRLLSMLQTSGTVPMIDIQAYAQWLNK